MEQIDSEWVVSRLSGRHGEKADLARALGIDRTKLSKILNGTRRIQAAEIPRLFAFFEAEHQLNENELRFLQAFRELPSGRRDEAERYLRFLAEQDSPGNAAVSQAKDSSK